MNENEDIKKEGLETPANEKIDYNFDFADQVNNNANGSEVADTAIVPEVAQPDQVLEVPEVEQASEVAQPEQTLEVPEVEQASEVVQPEQTLEAPVVEQASEVAQPEQTLEAPVVEQASEVVQPEQTLEAPVVEPKLVDVSVPVDTSSAMPVDNPVSTDPALSSNEEKPEGKTVKSGKSTIIFGIVLLILIAAFIIALPFIGGL